MLVQSTSKLCPFHISKHIFWVQVHFKVSMSGYYEQDKPELAILIKNNHDFIFMNRMLEERRKSEQYANQLHTPKHEYNHIKTWS